MGILKARAVRVNGVEQDKYMFARFDQPFAALELLTAMRV